MWNVKGKVIPVIIGTTGAISESFRASEQHNKESTKSRNYKKTAM